MKHKILFVIFGCLLCFSVRAAEVEFMKEIAPMVAEINQEIKKERGTINYIEYKLSRDELDISDEEMLEGFVTKYEINTQMKGVRRYAIILKELKLKVDVIPPSIMLAIAGLNTNWGKADFLKESNSLYRELVWYGEDGLKPKDEKDDDSYRIKIYSSQVESMRDYALKLNSSVDFMEFREARQRLVLRNKAISGKFLAPYLIFASDVPNAVGLIDYTITFYSLENLDENPLEDKSNEIVMQSISNVIKN